MEYFGSGGGGGEVSVLIMELMMKIVVMIMIIEFAMCTSPSALVMPNSLLGNASQQKEMTETAWCKVTDVFVVVVVD
ncbi:hypothetical protein TYRP_018447 [Tyrophagus putrescentiae]|nr:hypothetical protein TYRP_018447 [Tyrophagus putrescentiae]